MEASIKEAGPQDLHHALSVEREAFGSCVEADLVASLLSDETAKPTLSLIAFADGWPVGHILFTSAKIVGCEKTPASILAPLAVIPDYQKRGVGKKLVECGMEKLAENGVELVFVLGHPLYYSRHGFRPAGAIGFKAPYPIPEKDSDAWMVKPLKPGLIGEVNGTVQCANSLDKPGYWRE
jgi:putative acetyltransferase